MSIIRRKAFSRRNLNAHIGSASREYDGLHGGYGSRESNAQDKMILDFSSALEFAEANASFRKQMQKCWGLLKMGDSSTGKTGWFEAGCSVLHVGLKMGDSQTHVRVC